MTLNIDNNKVIFSRTFKAPIDKVFDAYTTKSQFEQWFHPDGATTEVYEFDIVKGGRAFYAIKAPGMTSYTVAEYNKVQRPYLLEYIDSFATAQGDKDTKMPSMKVILEFDKIDNHTTTVTSTSVFPTKEAAQQVVDMGVEKGMTQTLNQLEQLLK
ncbi:SRPBCC domain-containing protein [Staphylococcus simiae]|uniref:SRPBCC family protein n=1 Tax=Staphylococcus simiae TaxID=308354 RepID=UPI001A95A5D5|nr:SRPBCC domain-containing protein [Staphylococcus simiae]MBO1199650.1 SRPBCC domain-containing protein [Staphylococcus simiae]MBO1202027.1 SRPBCC domain-containing protein [Staphylococcus simiae]MBO1204242.1 SRPBCC domain-containing protein [Staphylococcus simiae]MBO1211696.1 SRPBCC domain-containing protein [Staphylococcus simiae]MBO1230442.1 SRPBCC domain-containing protein [Staphylococcus simiae]